MDVFIYFMKVTQVIAEFRTLILFLTSKSYIELNHFDSS